MRYGQIRKLDVANGLGIRVSLFVTGCRFNCPGCFNLAYQDFNYGNVFGEQEIDLILKYLSHPSISGLTILGGEPFQNEIELYEIVKIFREYIDKCNSNKTQNQTFKNIWIYSGYTFEQLLKDDNKLRLLSLCDVLVDGLFEIENLDLNLRFKGSSNQRIIDVKKSLEFNSIILYPLD